MIAGRSWQRGLSAAQVAAGIMNVQALVVDVLDGVTVGYRAVGPGDSIEQLIAAVESAAALGLGRMLTSSDERAIRIETEREVARRKAAAAAIAHDDHLCSPIKVFERGRQP
jgi:hypothetical protein